MMSGQRFNRMRKGRNIIIEKFRFNRRNKCFSSDPGPLQKRARVAVARAAPARMPWAPEVMKVKE